MKFLLIPIMVTLSTSLAFAQSEEEASPWAHESELSLVNITGNASSESSSAKQKTEYTADLNKYSLTGRYLQTKANGVETARAWDATGRYERSLVENVSAFAAHGAESDPFNGYVQRDNSDLGAKYDFIESEPEHLFVELGYRYTKTQPTVGLVTYSNFGRLYTEYKKDKDKTVSFKVWVEYLPNFTTSDAYLVNAEPSMNVMLSQVFSLKIGYLVKYHNLIVTPDEKRTDTTFTTSLIAKF